MKAKQQTLPNAPQQRSLTTVVLVVIEELPDIRSDIRAICDQVMHRATAFEYRTWCEESLVHGVRGALRARGVDGFPKMVNVNRAYTKPQQLTFPDYVQWAYDMAKRGREMNERAREIAVLCEEHLGRTFDADEVIHAASVGEDVTELVARLSA